MSCYGYSRQTTPYIDEIANRGVLFEKAFSCTNVTDSSVTSIFSGKFPSNHGLVHHGAKVGKDELKKLAKSYLLPEILRGRGYVTLAVDWLGRWHRRGYQFYSGIQSRQIATQKYFGKIQHSLKVYLTPTLDKLAMLTRGRPRALFLRKIHDTAAVMNDIALRLLEKCRGKKFFMFIHFWDTHFPYYPPSPFDRRFISEHDDCNDGSMRTIVAKIFNPEWRRHVQLWTFGLNNVNTLFARYDGCLNYVDHQIGRLMSALDQYGLTDKTLVVLTSDHGESLIEHEIFFDHHGLYDVSIHVPLILKGPLLPEKGQVKGLVQHTDIVPTLLDLLNIPCPNTLDGMNIQPLMNGETEQLHSAIYAEEHYYEKKAAIRTQSYKYIKALSKKGAICTSCQQVHGGIEELYNIKRDPEEKQNIVEEDRGIADVLKGQLEAKFLEYKKTFSERQRIMKRMQNLKRLGKV